MSLNVIITVTRPMESDYYYVRVTIDGDPVADDHYCGRTLNNGYCQFYVGNNLHIAR